MAVLKFVHVLGAVLMLGNVIVTGLWAHWAIKRPEPGVAAFGARAILWADAALTLTGGMFLTVSGVWMIREAGLDWWATPWLREGALALAASTGLWLAVLLPDQWRMDRLARAGDRVQLAKVYRRWAILGWGATGLLVYALWRMVVK